MGPIKLSDLPSPGKGRRGWPWTESTPEVTHDENILRWPKISIITPSYNQGEFIEETIRSVLLQGYPNLEYIVIDGGSTDNTVQILQKYEPFLKYISEPDKGQADAINKGLRMATGEIVAYLNSDDVYIQGTFLKIVKIFESRKDIFMVFGDIIHIDKKSKFIVGAPPGFSVVRITLKEPLSEDRIQDIAEEYNVIIEFDEDKVISVFGEKDNIKKGLKEISSFFRD